MFATDSKLTARGIAGLDPDGNPNWVDQTYENATKVVHDRTRQLMAMAAGSANLGQMPVGDFIASEAFPRCETAADENAAIVELLERMAAHKRAFWAQTQIEPADWPGPQLVMATASSERRRPRLWKASLQGDRYEHDEVLTEPGVLLDGTYEQVFSLLYG
ncbi:MAG: hypothetical protein ACTHU0_31385 [Kofleriaceae bacterium]